MSVSNVGASASRQIRDKLPHPVIDGDGHWLEPVPIFLDYLRQVAGSKAPDQFRTFTNAFLGSWYRMSPEERMKSRRMRSVWWAEAPSGNTLDRATAMLPNLLRARLDEFGIDFALIYPTLGAFGVLVPEEGLRRAVARAENMMAADLFRPHADRMTAVATVGAWTPREAIEEAEFAVTELGMKAIMTAGNIRRPVPAFVDGATDPMRVAYFIDSLGLDSEYDYDPFWAKCVELGVAVTDHGGSQGWPDRQSPTNFVYNHIGHFAAAHHAFCKALALGGVPHRFPELKFCFLEGGAGYGCNLYVDLVSHWEKRNRDAVTSNLRPDNLDVRKLRELVERHGDAAFKGRFEELLESLSPLSPFTSIDALCRRETDLDEFARSGIESAGDIRRMFERNFYFGCEADDPTAAWALDSRIGARLNAVFSSDIGHFDVTNMADVLAEAYELVEKELVRPEEFERFVFSNIAELHTALNPRFFDGTVVQDAVAALRRRHADDTPGRGG